MQEDKIPRVEIDLDIQLKEDKSGELKKTLLKNLDDEYNEIKNILNKGCPPKEYSLYQGLLSAIEAAKSVITQVWDRLHLT